jgi:hypothetical protein
LEVSRYGSAVSFDDETAAFLLFNLSGQLVGYQQYRPFADKKKHNDPKEGRYFTYAKNNLAVWGLETFHYRDDVLFLTEGVFDACKLHALNLPAVAVLANDPKMLRPWLFALTRFGVAVCDNDSAGMELAKCANLALTCTTGKDLGDMTLAEVREFLKQIKGL